MPRLLPLPRAMPVLWTGLILLACWLPAQHLPVPEPEGSGFLQIPSLDKIVHVALFGGFGLLWMLAGPAGWGRAPAVLASGVALAVISELGQAMPFVRRKPGVADVAADLIGLVVGIPLAVAVRGALGSRTPLPAGASAQSSID